MPRTPRASLTHPGAANHHASLKGAGRASTVDTDGTTIGVMGGRYPVSFNAEALKQTGRASGHEVDVELLVDPGR